MGRRADLGGESSLFPFQDFPGPESLDAHLTIPSHGWSKWHCFYMFLPTFCVFFLKWWETGMDLNDPIQQLRIQTFSVALWLQPWGHVLFCCSLITYSSSCRSISTTNLIYDTPLKRQKKSSTTRFVPTFFGENEFTNFVTG